MVAAPDEVMEFWTDDRVEPHLYLAGQVALLAAAVLLLLLIEPLLPRAA